MSYAAGGSDLRLKAGDYLFLIELVSGSRVRVDYLEFADSSSPVEAVSWGRIKNLYR